jgi:hypothetical protein
MERRPLKLSCIPATAFVSAQLIARFEGDVPMKCDPAAAGRGKVDVKVATTSIRPADFANASPFGLRTQRDPGRTALFAAAAIALLALLAGIVAVLTMHAPTP